MTIKELREKRAKLVTQARAKFDEIKPDTPAARAAEIEREFDAMMAEAASCEERAKRMERLEKAERSLDAGDDRRPLGDGDSQARGQAPAGDQPIDYREAFRQALTHRGVMADLPAEVRAAVDGYQPELRAQTAGTDAAGGFLVPDETMRSLVKSMIAWGPMYEDDFCTVLSTTGGGMLPLPGVDDTDKTADKTATEGAALGDTGTKDVVFNNRNLGDYMADTEFLRLSIQLLTGSLEAVDKVIADLLGERLGRRANNWLTVGTGTGMPTGIVTAATASAAVPASTSALAADEVLNFVHSINSAYRQSPKFRLMFNDNTLLALSKLKDGQGNYLLSEAPDGSGRLKIGPKAYKYAINDDMADIGANNRSMIGGDFSRYFVRKIGRPVIGTANDSKFWPGVGVAGYVRLDGALGDAKAIKALVHPAV